MLKHKKNLIIPGLILAVSMSAFAQLNLGYVDSQRILATNEAALDAQKKLEAESSKWTQELQKKEQEIKDKANMLDQQSLLLSDEKKQEKLQELQQLQQEAQRYQYEKWGDNGEAYRLRQQLLEPVIDKINVAIHKIGDDGGYDFIFDTINGNLLHADPKYDLTDQVIEELEKGTAEKTE